MIAAVIVSPANGKTAISKPHHFRGILITGDLCLINPELLTSWIAINIKALTINIVKSAAMAAT